MGEAMASGSNWLSGVNVVLVMAYGSLVRRPPTPFPQSCLDPVETPPLEQSPRVLILHPLTCTFFLALTPILREAREQVTDSHRPAPS